MSIHDLGRKGFATVCDSCGREQEVLKTRPEDHPEYFRCADCSKTKSEPQLNVRGRMLTLSEVEGQAEELEDPDMVSTLEVYNRRN